MHNHFLARCTFTAFTGCRPPVDWGKTKIPAVGFAACCGSSIHGRNVVFDSHIMSKVAALVAFFSRQEFLDKLAAFRSRPRSRPIQTRSRPKVATSQPYPTITATCSCAAMSPKKKQGRIRTTQARKLERPKKVLKDALIAFRTAAGDSEIVAETLWGLLTSEERADLSVHAQEAYDASSSTGLGKVVKQVAHYAEGTSDASSTARRLLAQAGKDVFKRKKRTEKALRFKFGRKVWSKACHRAGGKRGRKSIVKDPANIQKVREFLLANSQISSHYRKIGQELVQCRALSRSKSKLWKLNKDMQDLMSLTSWLLHLKVEHPQFTKFKKKVDMCPVCHKYDKLVVPRVKQCVEGAFHRVRAVDATYFGKLDNHWNSLVAAGKTDPEGKTGLQFVRGAINYIDKNMDARRLKPTPSGKGVRQQLNALRQAEIEAFKTLKSTLSLLEGCEHHFQSFRRQHQCREKMEEELPSDTILLQLDYAENLTLPVGPVEEQSWFWATARLSFSTLGIYASYHTEGSQQRVYFHYISQILDHTALHASVALKDCIRRLALPESCKCLHIWSDCGPHFKAYAFVATAVDILQTCPAISSVYFNFFGEHHGKGRNDGQFGLQRKWLKSFAERNVVSNRETLFRAFHEGARHTMPCDPPPAGPRYEVAHFHPEKPKTLLYLDVSSTDLNRLYLLPCLSAHSSHQVSSADGEFHSH